MLFTASQSDGFCVKPRHKPTADYVKLKDPRGGRDYRDNFVSKNSPCGLVFEVKT